MLGVGKERGVLEIRLILIRAVLGSYFRGGPRAFPAG